MLTILVHCLMFRENKENSFCVRRTNKIKHLMKRQSIWEDFFDMFTSPSSSSQRRPRKIHHDSLAAEELRENRCKLTCDTHQTPPDTMKFGSYLCVIQLESFFLCSHFTQLSTIIVNKNVNLYFIYNLHYNIHYPVNITKQELENHFCTMLQ